VFLGLLAAAAEQARHLEVPAAEGAVGGAVLEGGVERSTRLEGLLDRAAVLDALRRPNDSASAPMLAASQKCPSGRSGCARDGGAGGVDARPRARRLALGLRVRACPASSARARASRPTRSPAGCASSRAPRCRPPAGAARFSDRVERVRVAAGNLRAPVAVRIQQDEVMAALEAKTAIYNTQMQDLIRQLLANSVRIRRARGWSTRPNGSRRRCVPHERVPADIDEVLNGALFTVDYSEMVIVRDIDFYSLCEHHLLPFFGKCHVAYIPNGKVIGLSKIPRLVDIFARRCRCRSG
jgi:uncharacterized protein (DUF4415 family)